MITKDNIAFTHDNNSTNPKAPQYKGSGTIGGVQYWVSGWEAENDKGRYVQWKFEVKDARKEHSDTKSNAYQPTQKSYVNQEDVRTSSPKEADSDFVPF